MTWNPVTIANNAAYLQQEVKAGLPDFIEAKNAELGIGKLPGVGKSPATASTAINGKTPEGQAAARASSDANFRQDMQHKYQVHFSSVTSNVENPVISVVAFLPEEISLDVGAQYTAAFGEGLLDPSAGIVQKGLRLAGVSGVTQEMSVKIWQSSDGINISIPITFVAGEILGGKVVNNIMDPIMDLMSLCTPSKNDGDIFLTPPGPTLTSDFESIKKVLVDTVSLGASLAVDVAGAAGDLAQELPVVGPLTTAVKAAGNVFGAPALDVVTKTTGVDLSTFKVDSTKKNLEDLGKSINNVVRFNNKITVAIGDFIFLDNVVVNSVSQQYAMILDEVGNPMQATVNVSFTTMFTPTIQDLRKFFLHHSRRKA